MRDCIILASGLGLIIIIGILISFPPEPDGCKGLWNQPSPNSESNYRPMHFAMPISTTRESESPDGNDDDDDRSSLDDDCRQSPDHSKKRRR